MLAAQAMRWMDIGSPIMHTIAAAPYTPPQTSGTAIRTSRGPRLPRVTCSVLASASFSIFDSTVTPTTPEANQDTPASGSVVERLEKTLEEGEKNVEHGPSESTTLRGECSTTTKGDEHYSRFIEEDAGAEPMISAAAVCEPASCPPQTAMLRPEQEPGYFTAETRQYATDAELEDVLTSASEDEGGVGWDAARDNETLGYFNCNRWNLVLDSEHPDCAPHIVITPSEETWEDQYTSWQNRVDMQWPEYLMLPRLDTSSGRLPTLQPISRPLPSLPTLSPSLNDSLPPVLMFSPSRFQKSIESAAVERLVLTQVVKILQKALCKAAFFDASSLARSCRNRYDAVPSILLNIEPIFTWSDPAEPILAASQRHFGMIILDSTFPFRAPHIVISAPPPQLPQVTENNATPYTQDAGFGQRLIVRSYSVDIINAVEDWDDSSVYDDASSDVDVDQLESECASRPGTPTPETPVDEDGDHDFFYVRHGDEGHDDTGMDSVYSSVYCFDSHAESHIEIEAGDAKLQATSRPMFFIDEDEDDLPSLDDW